MGDTYNKLSFAQMFGASFSLFDFSSQKTEKVVHSISSSLFVFIRNAVEKTSWSKKDLTK